MTSAHGPRVVLDTNVVVSAILFRSGRLVWMREAWQVGRFIPLADRDTVAELLRVLTYPKFRLGAEERESLLAEYLPYVATVPAGRGDPPLQELRDAADQKFIDLARRAKADALITGDADILAIRDQLDEVDVLPAGEFQAWLAMRTAP